MEEKHLQLHDELRFFRQSLTNEEVFNLIEELGGEPRYMNDIIVSRTICHNGPHNGSYKLYYYGEGRGYVFRCYTGCEDPLFDIYQLVQKVNKVGYLESAKWVCSHSTHTVPNSLHNLLYNKIDLKNNSTSSIEADWHYLKKNPLENSSKQEQIVDFHIFDNKILNNFPKPRISLWEEEGISAEVMLHKGISYDPVNEGIIIPHYDVNGELIGIRERTLIEEQEKWGKYRPIKIGDTLYNHPLGYNLYNLNFSKANIKEAETAIIVEAEKSCLMYASYFGEDNDLSVAVCGSSLSDYQVGLLEATGAKNLVMAFDQASDFSDEKFAQYVKKFYKIQERFGKFFNISFVFDKDREYLKEKQGPLDLGKEVFLELFEKRIIL